MRYLFILFFVSQILPTLAFSQDSERSDSFFDKGFFNSERKPREEVPSEVEQREPEGELRDEEDSWQAPKRAKEGMVRGQDVAGSSKVRDYKNRTGIFAPKEEQTPSLGYQAVPLGGGATIIIPDGSRYPLGGRDVFANDP